jgi:hypothetical protein
VFTARYGLSLNIIQINVDLSRPCHSSRRLVAGISPWRLGFNPSPDHVTFVVDKRALGQVFLRVRRLFPVGVISAELYSPVFPNTALVVRKIGLTLETFKQSKAEKHFEIFHFRLDGAE